MADTVTRLFLNCDDIYPVQQRNGQKTWSFWSFAFVKPVQDNRRQRLWICVQAENMEKKTHDLSYLAQVIRGEVSISFFKKIVSPFPEIKISQSHAGVLACRLRIVMPCFLPTRLGGFVYWIKRMQSESD